MVQVLLAGIIAMVISIAAGPKFIEFLRRNEFGQTIRAEGPETHIGKQGTPTMGGLLIMASMVVPFLVFSHRTLQALTVFAVTLGCAAIGFVDDWTKITHRRSLGLSGRWKMVLLALLTALVAVVAERLGAEEGFDQTVYVPLVGVDLELSYGWYVLLFLMIAGTANGVNLTDGLDGLAAGTVTISLFTYTAMAVVAWIVSGGGGGGQQSQLDLAILGSSLIGASIGFLWYNAFPAQVFMGDTGSLGLGGAIATFAVMTHTEVLLILIGGIFVIEALSVILQVLSYRWTGKRIFLMAPVHHHFEMKAWSEARIMVRFWIAALIFCACAFVLFYRYFEFFRF
ncbi:MAG: phospho-N-acetylmuramoyl-pentapeptide-transferase [Gaiellales bacterium]